MATRKAKHTGKGGSSIGSAVLWLLTRVALPLVLLYAFLWWRADAAVERQLDRLRASLEIERGPTVLGLNGDIGFRDLVVRPRADSALPRLTLTAERAVLQTPGLFWLVRVIVEGLPDEVPSRLGFSLEGSRVDGDQAALDSAWAAGHVLFPFDLAGCEPVMSAEVARQLGLDQARNNFSFTMTRAGSNDLNLHFEAETAPMASISGDVVLGLGQGDAGMRLASASFNSLRFDIVDQGFVTRRNEYCAGKLGVSAAEFVPLHLEAVRAGFAADGMVPGAAMSQAYAGFSQGDGRLTVQARPLRPGPLMQMQGITLANMGLFFDATVKHDDNFTAPLVFLPLDEVAPVAADVVAAPAQDSPALDPGSAAAPGAGAEPPSATPPGGLVAGDEIEFEALPGYLGSEVLVETKLGTERRGVLTGASSVSLVVQLVAAEGGFSLSMPKNNVVKVRLAPPLSETPDSPDHAQAQ